MKRLSKMEARQDKFVETIDQLQQTVDEMRDSAIRGEIASGQKTKDVADKFNITPSRVSQIAPRRKYNNC